MLIENLAAVITGGASGLGAASGRALAEAGAKVTLLDLDQEGTKAQAEEISGLGLHCDVTDAESAQAAMAKAEKAHGPCRILVNCAGIAPAGRIVGREGPMALEDFKTVINVNLIGTFNLMRLAAHRMSLTDPLADGERGVIISTASFG